MSTDKDLMLFEITYGTQGIHVEVGRYDRGLTHRRPFHSDSWRPDRETELWILCSSKKCTEYMTIASELCSATINGAQAHLSSNTYLKVCYHRHTI